MRFTEGDKEAFLGGSTSGLTFIPSRELKAYLDYSSGRRSHQALGGLAPLEFLARMQGDSVP
jgi:hypothetical protein